MTVRVTHAKVLLIPDGPDETVARPSDWNGDHVLEGLGTAAEANIEDFATAAQGAKADTAVQPAAIANIREVLTANRTYYVRTDGSDSNTGLVNDAAGAFLTVQKAIDTAATLDTAIYDVTIQIDAGTYTTATGLLAKQCVGAGSVIILGDETTPSNVILATNGVMASTDGGLLSIGVRTIYKLRGVQLSTTATGTKFCVVASTGSLIDIQSIDVGTGWTQHFRAEDGGIVRATGNYSLSSGANSHWEAVGAGIVRVQSRTVTLTGTPAFVVGFAVGSRLGCIFGNGNTFSGAATGKRYSAFENGVIAVAGGGATYLPGDVAGTTATGGQYN